MHTILNAANFQAMGSDAALSSDWSRWRFGNGSSTAKVIHYSIKRWTALAHYTGDGQVPIDNNWIENRIRPIATGRKNWLFAGSLRAGNRTAAIMSLIQSAKLNGHAPFLYLKDSSLVCRLSPIAGSANGYPIAGSLTPQLEKQGGFAGRLQSTSQFDVG